MTEPLIEVTLDENEWREEQAARAVRSLQEASPTLDPAWFYDTAGSDLFDEITRLPEYYLTRAERSLLHAHAGEIAAWGATALVELGSGTSDKTRVLLDAMVAEGSLETYVPIDVSEQTLRDAVRSLSKEYPKVAMHGIVADFHGCFERIPKAEKRLVAFLGSTIGNLDPAQRARFLFDLDCALTRDDCILLGIDLVKDPDRILAAYNDSAGVTAAFNRNALRVLNEELGSNFEPDQFTHRAVWDNDQHRIEMRLHAESDQTVIVPAVEEPLFFPAGSEIRTEISSKFTIERMTEELWNRNFVVDKVWVTEGNEFALIRSQPYC